MNKKLFSLLLLIYFSIFNFAFSLEMYEISFIKGDFSTKAKALEEAYKNNDLNFIINSLNFCLEANNVLLSDKDLADLTEKNILFIPENNSLKSENVSSLLNTVFNSFNENNVKCAAVKKMAFYSDEECIRSLNKYLEEKIENNENADELTGQIIKTLSQTGNAQSSSILFTLAVTERWPEFSSLLNEVSFKLSDKPGNEILNIFSSADTNAKVVILKKIEFSQNFSKKIKGELAEKALSDCIYNTGDVSRTEKSFVELQLQSLKMLSDLDWTRAGTLVNNYFPIACTEYEYKVLSDEQFASVITDCTFTKSTQMVLQFSSYLDSLNAGMEKGKIPSKEIILALINSLGRIGDKNAFDSLLYVTYLDYDKEVILAARESLSKLKW